MSNIYAALSINVSNIPGGRSVGGNMTSPSNLCIDQVKLVKGQGSPLKSQCARNSSLSV